MFKLKNILCPTDFSHSSEYALAMAAALARDHHARLIVLHALRPGVVYGEFVPAPPIPPDEFIAKIGEMIHRLEAVDARALDLHIETQVIEGTPAEVILDVAKEVDAGMIVMGTHGRTGLSRLLMGSVAEEVLRRAACPVLTVKQPVPALAAVAVPVTAQGREN